MLTWKLKALLNLNPTAALNVKRCNCLGFLSAFAKHVVAMALVCFYYISCAELKLLFYIVNEILTFFRIKNKFGLSAIFLCYLVKCKISSSKLHNSVSLGWLSACIYNGQSCIFVKCPVFVQKISGHPKLVLMIEYFCSILYNN
jgi:hypothetical protein